LPSIVPLSGDDPPHLAYHPIHIRAGGRAARQQKEQLNHGIPMQTLPTAHPCIFYR